jgi:hypothetical protein
MTDGKKTKRPNCRNAGKVFQGEGESVREVKKTKTLPSADDQTGPEARMKKPWCGIINAVPRQI